MLKSSRSKKLQVFGCFNWGQGCELSNCECCWDYYYFFFSPSFPFVCIFLFFFKNWFLCIRTGKIMTRWKEIYSVQRFMNWPKVMDMTCSRFFNKWRKTENSGNDSLAVAKHLMVSFQKQVIGWKALEVRAIYAVPLSPHLSFVNECFVASLAQFLGRVGQLWACFWVAIKRGSQLCAYLGVNTLDIAGMTFVGRLLPWHMVFNFVCWAEGLIFCLGVAVS